MCGEKPKVLLSKKELSELPYQKFRKSNVHCYMDRTDESYLGGKYCAFNDLHYAKFSTYYRCNTSKSRESGSEYQPDELLKTFVAQNHKENDYPKVIKLMQSKEKDEVSWSKESSLIMCWILSYIQKDLWAKIYLLMSFCPFKNENELYQEHHHCTKINFLEPGVQDVITIIKLSLNHLII